MIKLTLISSLLILFTIGCGSIQTGGGYMHDGWGVEVTGLSHETEAGPFKNIGVRGTFGEEHLLPEWEHDKTYRYALSGLTQIRIYKGIYVEPRLDLVYYPNLDTAFEPEFGFRVGYKYKKIGIYIGARRPLGNGDLHLLEDPPEYRHIPDGWKLEYGVFLSVDF
jgi:hypothetical protein